jgi:hypothetical protein
LAEEETGSETPKILAEEVWLKEDFVTLFLL